MDWDREARTGTAEAVLCEGKSPEIVAAIVDKALDHGRRLLLTRIAEHHLTLLDRPGVDLDRESGTAILGPPSSDTRAGACIVTAGSSDIGIAREASRTLAFHGYAGPVISDVGVAGLWRLMERLDEIRSHRVLIAVAGMEGALFSVLTGLVRAPVIAVPSPVGYGVARDGAAALSSALATCAAGLTVVNTGNGFGAACAAIRMLRMADPE